MSALNQRKRQFINTIQRTLHARRLLYINLKMPLKHTQHYNSQLAIRIRRGTMCEPNCGHKILGMLSGAILRLAGYSKFLRFGTRHAQ
jgi:hypothetical protein